TREMPDDIQRATIELELQIGLGVPQTLLKGFSAPEVGETYARAQELCERLGETPQIFPVLHGLWRFYLVRGDLRAARQMAHSLSALADAVQDPRAASGSWMGRRGNGILDGRIHDRGDAVTAGHCVVRFHASFAVRTDLRIRLWRDHPDLPRNGSVDSRLSG